MLIASDELVASWSEVGAVPTDLIAVSDADARHAIDIIARHRPRVVVLEQFFASTARGLALVISTYGCSPRTGPGRTVSGQRPVVAPWPTCPSLFVARHPAGYVGSGCDRGLRLSSMALWLRL